MNRAELVGKRAGPIGEHLDDRHVVDDGEGEIQIGEAVAAAERERSDDGAGDDALVLLGESQHAVTESIPLLHGEQRARV